MNKIMRLAAIAALILVTQPSLSAGCSLVIHRNDGSEDVFLIGEKPVITFVGQDLNIQYEGSTMSIARNLIKNIKFEYNLFSSISIESAPTQIEVIDSNTIRFSNTTSADLEVYDINGHNINSACIVSDGASTTVCLDICDKRIYTIKYNDKFLKFIKR